MLYIRTDMNPVIATGHVMRCLSIADAVKAMGGKVLFIVSDESSVPPISERGFDAFVLYSNWRDLEDGTEQVLDMIGSEDVVLVDSYSKSFIFMAEIKKKAYVMYLDDLNEEIHPVNGILCYAPYYTKFDFPALYPDTDLLLGPEYAPLRAEFCQCKCMEKEIPEQVQNILVLSGGADSYRAIPKILKSIPENSYKSVYAICGMYSSYYSELCAAYAGVEKVHILKSVPNLKEYMEMADIAITAGGSTLYELCAVGTPAITYSFADNQLPNVHAFAEQGIIPYVGDFRFDDVARHMQEELKRMAEFFVRREVSKKMRQMVDGKGAQRIAEFICAKCVK